MEGTREYAKTAKRGGGKNKREEMERGQNHCRYIAGQWFWFFY